MDDNVFIHLPNAILEKYLDNVKLTPEIEAKYLEHINAHRTEQEVKIQMECKDKLSMIKSVQLDEQFDFDMSKISLLNRISNELKSLKGFVLSFRSANIEFDNYYEIYCRFQELSLLYNYLKADIEKENGKIR